MKWIKDLNGTAHSIKLLEKKHKYKYCEIGSDNSFLNMTPKAYATKEKKLINWISS